MSESANGDTPMDDVASSSAQIQAPAKAKKVTEALKIPPTVQERWRDATVASLSLLPPAAVASSASVQDALTLSRAHNGQCVLIVDDAHVRGFVDLIDLVAHETQGSPDDAVAEIQRSFGDAPSTFPTTFRVIHTATPLAEVAVFLETAPMALVTDEACTQIVHVVTQGDLTRYADRMGIDMRPSALGSRVEEESSRDRSLADVLRLLDGYAPLIPDEVSDYYLERAGFQCDDVRLKRLLALATEKFVADIASDAFQYARIRTNAGPNRSSRPGATARDRTRTVLTMDDLSAALGEYGIDARRAETFR
ncbi:transcription initiation factor iid taf10 subunit [Malassezia pachydermatis]|uniref:Transcription initiation factor iid taf10 subunit n=1 Tax=Malassezia pachydermatis TaxID=77020 RepID=A0A0M9VP12_9BASI|nr:transcription initiation factor iid taf10 subunit [Malassezia pachydermatis]KOS13935.1 transcription initiation factor iid taf10 subunit [Malassezia pachydermatis]